MAYLQRVIDEFADIPHWRHGTLGEAAKRDLFELTHLVVGATAPEISGTDVDGEEMSLSDFRGRVVVLDFWGSWCGPCIGQLPALNAVAEEFGERVAVLGVMSDPPQTARQAVAEHGVQFRNWVDGRRGPIVKEWNIDSWPTTFLIDADGVIRQTHADDGSLRDAVFHLLHEDALQR
jgi:peroxiredoxin